MFWPLWTLKSACLSPSKLSDGYARRRHRIITRPSTGSLKIPVVTVLPFQSTSRGSPTLTEITCTISYLL
ncbi:hypothetical protein GXM_07853 [Nostoc sphaeroides CCNUC1]|uniref:Uncharacterized protein n=1 Tax=Nostoc sphaeroides CCNUC1 TaxID=2653204 RepID=A0A5P8WEN7_9NOSO|nr:hypothetical protein GXM_07853 [Nostoc sphaeroides CCNUC1]